MTISDAIFLPPINEVTGKKDGILRYYLFTLLCYTLNQIEDDVPTFCKKNNALRRSTY